MDSVRENLASAEQRTRKVLLTAVQAGEAAYADIEVLFASYRTASENLIFHDFFLPSSDQIEIRLWAAHCHVNKDVFHKAFKKFKKEDGKEKVVERRKTEKNHGRFIKSSQSFYRGYIQRLSSHFANVDEVLNAARQIKSEALSVDEPVVVDEVQKRQIIQSCHSSLVHLGDLSRYREKESHSKDKNWGPAVGYYNLAIKLLPTSGAPYNQLAIIADEDQAPLRAIYYFYRALMVQDPPTFTRPSIDREFEKLRRSWDEPESHMVKDGIFTDFQSRFIAFHAFCDAGIDFDGYRDLETELIHEITVTLPAKPDASLLNRIALINIAAEAAARERLLDKKGLVLSCSFNVKLFSQLLQVITTELRRIKKLDASSELDENGKLTPKVRHLLPLLRQYSSWLLTDIPNLVDAQINYSKTSPREVALVANIKELWRNYTEMLDLLAPTYQLRGERQLEYLLAEDEDALGFKPFADEYVSKSRYFDDIGKLKPRYTDLNVQREEPTEEMLHRIRGIVKDGITIAKSTDPRRVVSVRLEDGRFVCLQREVASMQPDISGQILPSQALSGPLEVSQSHSKEPRQDASSMSIDTEMRDMVDDLLDERLSKQKRPMESHWKQSESVRKSTYTAADLVRQIQQSSRSPSLQSHTGHSSVSSFFSSGLANISGLRPGSAHVSQPFKTSAGPPHAPSGHSLTNQLIRQQQEIQARSSPQQSLPQPSSWSNYDTPTGFNSIINAQPRSPSWRGSPSTPLETAEEEVKKPMPQRNLFGAIGEAKTPTRTPTSAQPS